MDFSGINMAISPPPLYEEAWLEVEKQLYAPLTLNINGSGVAIVSNPASLEVVLSSCQGNSNSVLSTIRNRVWRWHS